ncbi:uncharacterized protein [Onthophagus taurus]|uniref:uncharacterized protein n=1 Tax=Onthophagus taurus TaxID=166361 RepID=UPI0039BDCE20
MLHLIGNSHARGSDNTDGMTDPLVAVLPRNNDSTNVVESSLPSLPLYCSSNFDGLSRTMQDFTTDPPLYEQIMTELRSQPGNDNGAIVTTSPTLSSYGLTRISMEIREEGTYQEVVVPPEPATNQADVVQPLPDIVHTDVTSQAPAENQVLAAPSVPATEDVSQPSDRICVSPVFSSGPIRYTSRRIKKRVNLLSRGCVKQTTRPNPSPASQDSCRLLRNALAKLPRNTRRVPTLATVTRPATVVTSPPEVTIDIRDSPPPITTIPPQNVVFPPPLPIPTIPQRQNLPAVNTAHPDPWVDAFLHSTTNLASSLLSQEVFFILGLKPQLQTKVTTLEHHKRHFVNELNAVNQNPTVCFAASSNILNMYNTKINLYKSLLRLLPDNG